MDFEFRQHLIAQGANPNQLGNLGLMRFYGVNKIVWYGNIGNVMQIYIYLKSITSSKSSINLLEHFIMDYFKHMQDIICCKKLPKFCKLGN